MREFRPRQLHEALDYAAAGGQALHLHRHLGNLNRAPTCFINAVAKDEYIAHLFDRDRGRLIETARRLGVRVIRIGREGTPSQHIDLCGTPLAGAIYECEHGEPWPYGPIPKATKSH